MVMKTVILFVIVTLNLSVMNAQETQTIDPIKYQGDWYVIGFKPSFLDKNWMNTKENYTWNLTTQRIIDILEKDEV